MICDSLNSHYCSSSRVPRPASASDFLLSPQRASWGGLESRGEEDHGVRVAQPRTDKKAYETGFADRPRAWGSTILPCRQVVFLYDTSLGQVVCFAPANVEDVDNVRTGLS